MERIGYNKALHDTQSEIVPLGTQTRWGRIVAATNKGGERYYMMQKGNLTSLMPADVVEADAPPPPSQAYRR